jgi:hypothetical protein
MNIQEIVIQKAAKEIQLAIDLEVFQSFFNNESMKIVWERDTAYPLIVVARIAYDHGPITQTGLREHDLEPIQLWCMHNRCGRRTSFDTFKFRNEAELSLFLLKWG